MTMTFKMMAVALITSGAATAASASPVALVAGQSLREQTAAMVAQAGYTLQWELPVDAPARGAAHPYDNWMYAVYGAMKDMSTAMVAENGQTPLGEFAAPVACDGTKVVVVTTVAKARQLVASSSDGCRALK